MHIGDILVGRAADRVTFERSEHGGVVTSLLRFALENDVVDVAVGVRQGNDRYQGILSFSSDPDEVNGWAGSLHFATPGIARNIREFVGTHNQRVAAVCRSCDARALSELAKINQVNTDNIFMIGINCSGTMLPIPHMKMLEDMGHNPYDLTYEEIDDEILRLEFKNGRQEELELDDLENRGLGRRTNCQRCEHPIPRMADLACGKWGMNGDKGTLIEVCSNRGRELLEAAVAGRAVTLRQATQQQIQARAGEEKCQIDSARKKQEESSQKHKPETDSRWEGEFQRCIKCYGCRDVCPLCHCQRCVLERDLPQTVKKGVLPVPITFGMIRAFHVACSCVNCGQCADVCSADIPIPTLVHHLTKHCTELFGEEPGLDVTGPVRFGAVPLAERELAGTELTTPT